MQASGCVPSEDLLSWGSDIPHAPFQDELWSTWEVGAHLKWPVLMTLRCLTRKLEVSHTCEIWAVIEMDLHCHAHAKEP